MSTTGRMERSFDSSLYLSLEIDAIRRTLDSSPGCWHVIEIGGKPFGDYHAARVLPGYDPDCKASILRTLQQERKVDIALVLSARDILPSQARVRDDTGFKYHIEACRVIADAREIHDLEISSVVISMCPRDFFHVEQGKLDRIRREIRKHTQLPVLTYYEVAGYPEVGCLANPVAAFEGNDSPSSGSSDLVLVSPGGGSGKFGVALGEMFRRAESGTPSKLIKLETFPIPTLSIGHPLNLAFEAGSADLGNRLVALPDGRTNYNKDVENHRLLSELSAAVDINGELVTCPNSPADFVINSVHAAICDMRKVVNASTQEIRRRLESFSGAALTKAGSTSAVVQVLEILNRAERYNPDLHS